MIKEVVSQFGSVDVLVNNAGITKDNLLMRMKEQEWDDVIDTNLKVCLTVFKSNATNVAST